MNPNLIPQNPIKELDELYVKDDKILISDCGDIAADYFKQRDDENFEKELLLLTQELQQLDEGKYSGQSSTHTPSISQSNHQANDRRRVRTISLESTVHFVSLALTSTRLGKFTTVLMMTPPSC